MVVCLLVGRLSDCHRRKPSSSRSGPGSPCCSSHPRSGSGDVTAETLEPSSTRGRANLCWDSAPGGVLICGVREIFRVGALELCAKCAARRRPKELADEAPRCSNGLQRMGGHRYRLCDFGAASIAGVDQLYRRPPRRLPSLSCRLLLKGLKALPPKVVNEAQCEDPWRLTPLQLLDERRRVEQTQPASMGASKYRSCRPPLYRGHSI